MTMEPFKNIYNEAFFDKFTVYFQKIKPDFNSKSFIKDIFKDDWKNKELKERMRHTTLTLGKYLPNDFEGNAKTIRRLIDYFEEDEIKESSIEYMFLPDFIEIFGIDYFDSSMLAIERITQFTSCEFAIRPFIIKHPKKTIEQMHKWSKHEHAMVRRLSTEGARPRLPWAMAIPNLKKDPTPILLILETLKNDSSESVRRSVANNLNDIAKDNPSIVISLAKKWIGKSTETDWVVKHACRTLLKKGDTEVLELFGLGYSKDTIVENLKILTPTVPIGEALEFQFDLINHSRTEQKIRLEYGLHYLKANDTLSKKVFKISEKTYPPLSKTPITRKQSFKIITTRKFHIGKHGLSIIINGKEFDMLNFDLIN